MFQRLVAIILLMSFFAMAASGLAMFVVQKPSFSMEMRPFHNFFGLTLVAASLAHVWVNRHELLQHLKTPFMGVVVGAMASAMVLTYLYATANPLPPDMAVQMDTAAEQADVQRGM